MPMLMHGNRVWFSQQEVAARVTPRNRLSPVSHWFDFDDVGNIINSDISADERGIGASRLADEARQFFQEIKGGF